MEGAEPVWRWDSLEELSARTCARPWVLIEATEHEVLVSPIFRPDVQGCFDCYLRRRLSTGAPGLAWIAEIGVVHFAQVMSLVLEGTRLLAGAIRIARDGSTTAHRLLPIPGCACWRSEPRASTWDTLTSLVDPHLGVVPHFREAPIARWGMKAVIAYGANTEAILGHRAANVGLAADWTIEAARRRAAAESVERYCAAFVPPHAVAAVERPGMPGRRWRTGADVRGPATEIYLPFTGPGAKRTQTSEGLAAGDSLESATEHACAELIERDTLIKCWERRRGVRHHERRGEVHLTDLNSPRGWSISVAWVSRTAIPYLLMGVAARRDSGAAQTSAIKELACIEAFGSEIWASVAVGVDQLSRRVREDETEAARLAQWLSLPKSIGAREAPPDFDVFDVTTEDVRGAGWRVVRALRIGRIETDGV